MTGTSTIDTPDARIRCLLRCLYGESTGAATGNALDASLSARPLPPGLSPAPSLSEQDALLITYADQVREPGIPPLRTLAAFCSQWLNDVVSGIHILPFYPWSSDDGFSVKDYFEVAPEFGSWDDVARFHPHFDLMFDAVFNHASAQGEWFQRFLQDDPRFQDFFVTVDGNPDLSQVVRPRALPLLTDFPSAPGTKRIWTTFSADQVDLNIKNPQVLLALVEVMLFYVDRGARYLRLDAIAYLWKDIGTSCIHRPQTHTVIQLLRAVLDRVAPHVQLITETNVPHADNVSYFGDGRNEAQLVYNFALPPLVLHAILRGDATHLSRWASRLQTPSDRTTFLNFLASHDGIGLNPARGILPSSEVDFVVERCRAHGGFVGEKHNPDGSTSPYEMNIVYFDAVNDPAAGEPTATQVNRFMVAQAILLALAGVPAIYFHSLFGSRNDRAGALQTGIYRRINRQKLDRSALETELSDSQSLRSLVFERYRALLHARRSHAAFHPQASQCVLEGDARVFAVVRAVGPEGPWVLCLHNVSSNPVTVEVRLHSQAPYSACQELFASRVHEVNGFGSMRVRLGPFEANWLNGSGPQPAHLRPAG